MRLKQFSMPLILLGGLLAGLVLAVLVYFSGPVSDWKGSTSSRQFPPSVGAAVGDFTLQGLDGASLSLADYRGRPVLVNFWATWCPPCREEMPLLDQTSQTYSDRLVVIGVDYGESESVVSDFIQKTGIQFLIALDREGEVSNQYYVRSYPATFFIDSNGILRAQHLGALTEVSLATYLKTIGVE